MESERPLFIPVILGTTRQGRMSAHPARLMAEEIVRRPGVETELIDIAGLPMPAAGDDAWEAIRRTGFADQMNRADAQP